MNFSQTYVKKVGPDLKKKLGLKNIFSIPKIKKIIVNVGVGTYLKSEKNVDDVVNGLSKITGQKPVIRNAKISVSNFKLREGSTNGVLVTLRKKRMYDFLERLIKVVFPRIRDFRGFSTKSFDSCGNYSFGISDHLIFPEIPTDKVIKSFGLQITLQIDSKNKDHSISLLKEFGFPFKSI